MPATGTRSRPTSPGTPRRSSRTASAPTAGKVSDPRRRGSLVRSFVVEPAAGVARSERTGHRVGPWRSMKKKHIVLMVAGAAVLGAGGFAASRRGPKPTPVEVATVGREDLQ